MLLRFWNFLKGLFGAKAQPSAPTIQPAPPPVITPLPSASNLTVGSITGASPGEKLMILTAIGYLEKVIRAPEFKTAMLAANFTETNGFSNQQIYDMYFSQQMTVNVDDFTGTWTQNNVWHTMGYEAGDGYVHANRVFVYDAITMMSLIAHELAHEPLGFHHSSATDYTSVPYTMNAIVEYVAKLIGISR